MSSKVKREGTKRTKGEESTTCTRLHEAPHPTEVLVSLTWIWEKLHIYQRSIRVMVETFRPMQARPQTSCPMKAHPGLRRRVARHNPESIPTPALDPPPSTTRPMQASIPSCHTHGPLLVSQPLPVCWLEKSYHVPIGAADRCNRPMCWILDRPIKVRAQTKGPLDCPIHVSNVKTQER